VTSAKPQLANLEGRSRWRLFHRRPGGRLIQYRDCGINADLMIPELWRRCASVTVGPLAWEEFVAGTRPLVAGIAGRAARQWNVHDASYVDDLVQDIYLKLSQVARSGMREFAVGDEGLLPYIKATAANTARDSLRARFASKRGAYATVELDDHLAKLADCLERHGMDRKVLVRQLDDLLEGSAREQAIFWLYYRQGLTAKEIAAVPAACLTAKGVESLLHRMTLALRARLGLQPPSKGDTRAF